VNYRTFCVENVYQWLTHMTAIACGSRSRRC